MSRLPRRHEGSAVVDVAGIPLADLSPQDAAHLVAKSTASGAAGDVHLVNAYTISLLATNQSLDATLRAAWLNLADGKPLTWAARLLHGRRLHQVRGPALFEDVLAVGHEYGLRHYFLGGTDQTLALLVDHVRASHPQAEIAGSFSPPFRPLELTELAEQDSAIRGSDANIVWVGLGTPKQDREVARLARDVGITAVAVGAAFDYSAGTLRQAPGWMRGLGVEWLFRLAMEPRRLWRRYTIGNVRFIKAVSAHRPASPTGLRRQRRRK